MQDPSLRGILWKGARPFTTGDFMELLEIGSRVQPFSKESRAMAPRIRDAKVVHSICPIVP